MFGKTVDEGLKLPAGIDVNDLDLPNGLAGLFDSKPANSTTSAESGVHKANIILGRLALIEDDIALASYRLLEAGKVEGSAPLGGLGPNMSLAAELLERGEKDVVLEYFELCSKVLA